MSEGVAVTHVRASRLRSLAVLSLVSAMILLAFFAVAAPVRADHDTIPWANPTWVTGSAANEQQSSILTDGKGHVFVFYVVSNSFQFNNISMTEYTTYGAFGGPGFVMTRQVTLDPTSARTASPSYPPAVAIDHTGNLYVAWVKQAGYTGGRGDDVYVSRSSDGGNTWVPTLASAPNGLGNDNRPSVAVAPNGRIWLAWGQNWNGWNNITVAYSDSAGASFTGFTNLTTPAARFYGVATPTVTVDSTSRAYVGYSQQQISGYWSVYLAWSDTGAAWTTQAISTFLPTFAYFPSVVAETNGKIHVAWWDNRFAPYGGTTIWYRQSPDRGATWLPELLLSSERGPANVGQVKVNLQGDNLVVTYQSSGAPGGALGQAISADHGSTWYPGATQTFERSTFDFSAAMDENGTLWAGMTFNPFGSNDIWLSYWNGPPSPPSIVDVAPATGQLTVKWSAPPEKDVVAFAIWRSSDGSSYQVIATVSAPTTSYVDASLANGTYWYKVTAVDNFGTPSHASAPASGVVGPTTAELIANLQAQIDALQSQLSDAQANITAIQAQLDSLQTQLTNLQSTTNTDYTNLQSQINDLRSRLDAIRSEQATQSQTWLLTLLVIVVIVLLVFMFLQQRRMSSMRSQLPRSMRMAPPQEPPAPPSMAPAPPAQPPTLPEDDL